MIKIFKRIFIISFTLTRNNSFTLQGAHRDANTRSAHTSVAKTSTQKMRRAISDHASSSSSRAPMMTSQRNTQRAANTCGNRKDSSPNAGIHRDKIYSSKKTNTHIFTTTDRALAEKLHNRGAGVMKTNHPNHNASMHYNNDPDRNHSHLKYASATEMLNSFGSALNGFSRSERTQARAAAIRQGQNN